MTEATENRPDAKALRNVKILAGLAIAAALVATAVGLLFWLAPPEAGSSLEATLGITAAVSGLAAGLFAAAAAIYAQVKNLWRYAPMWFRVAVMVFVVAIVVVTLMGWLNSAGT